MFLGLARASALEAAVTRKERRAKQLAGSGLSGEKASPRLGLQFAATRICWRPQSCYY
jgi:hypothetical protein